MTDFNAGETLKTIFKKNSDLHCPSSKLAFVTFLNGLISETFKLRLPACEQAI